MKNMYSGTPGAGMSFSAKLQQAELAETNLLVSDPAEKFSGVCGPDRKLGISDHIIHGGKRTDEKRN